MYGNLSRIHDIHYRWGLPFCTQVAGAEFSMICAPTAANCSFFSHPSIHSFLHTYPLPLEPCFIPSQLPFIPVQAFGLLSSHPSLSQILHLYFHLSIPLFPCLIPCYLDTMEGGREREYVTREDGNPLGLPLQCHHTLICLLRLYIDFVLNKGKTQKEWGARGGVKLEKKKKMTQRGKRVRGRKEEKGKVVLRIKSMSWIPSGSWVIIRRLLYRGWTQKKEAGREGSHGE